MDFQPIQQAVGVMTPAVRDGHLLATPQGMGGMGGMGGPMQARVSRGGQFLQVLPAATLKSVKSWALMGSMLSLPSLLAVLPNLLGGQDEGEVRRSVSRSVTFFGGGDNPRLSVGRLLLYVAYQASTIYFYFRVVFVPRGRLEDPAPFSCSVLRSGVVSCQGGPGGPPAFTQQQAS